MPQATELRRIKISHRIFLLINFVVFMPFVLILTVLFWIKILISKKNNCLEDSYFIGLGEVCQTAGDFQRLLQEKGCQVYFVIDSPTVFSYQGKPNEILWNSHSKNNTILKKILCFYTIAIKKVFMFNKILKKNRNFLFLGSSTFFPLQLDLPLLKLAKKNILMMRVGGDVRYQEICNRIFRKYQIPYSYHYAKEDKFFDFLSRFFKQKWPVFLKIPILTGRNAETFMSEKGIYYVGFFPQYPIVSGYKKTNFVPVIVHAPSNRIIKGTDFVLKAINTLKNKGLVFEFRLFEKTQNSIILKNLKETDILIDAPGPVHGRLGTEGMAAGCCIVGPNHKNFKDYYEEILSPIIQFERDSQKLAVALENLILNPEICQQKMNECFDFWKNYYSPDHCFETLKGILSGKLKPDLFPYQNHKKTLLEVSENWFQRSIIRLFY
jgi:hypothetical protein